MTVGRLSCFSRLVETIRNRVERNHIVREPRLMKRVVPPELLPDMVLAKPVVNANGLPIVAAGTILDAAMIERLRQMELTSVYVEGDAGNSGGKTLAELEAELDHRFRQVAQDPIQQLILRALRTHLRATHGMASEGPQAT
jgi:hypothetical protein